MSRYHHASRSVAAWMPPELVPSNLTIDEVGKFWVVTAASEHSELNDILFKHTVPSIGVSFKGGLRAENILGVFKDEGRAREFALKQLP